MFGMRGHLLPKKRSLFPSLEAIQESDKERLLDNGSNDGSAEGIMSPKRRVWSWCSRIQFPKKMTLAFIFIFGFIIISLIGLVSQSSSPSTATATAKTTTTTTTTTTSSDGQGISTTRWLFEQVKEKASDLGRSRQGHDSKKRERVVVVATTSQQDTSWTDDLPESWSAHKFIMDDKTLKPHSVPRNVGREAMAYLTYIITEYDNLPEIVAFVHGHFTAWHQPETITSRLEDLNITHLYQNQFTSLRCKGNDDADWAKVNFWAIKPWNFLGPFWRVIFPDGDPVTNVTDFPQTVRIHNGAQFATTRENLRRRSKEDWERIRWPLIRGVEEFDELKRIADSVDGNYNYALGMVFEPIWHILMGKDPDWRPPVDECRQVQFSNRTVCNYYPDFKHDRYDTDPPKCYRQQWDESLGEWAREKSTQLELWKLHKAYNETLEVDHQGEEAEKAEEEGEEEDEEEKEEEEEEEDEEEDEEEQEEREKLEESELKEGEAEKRPPLVDNGGKEKHDDERKND
ncbi:MAG: hypothetical protein M1831_004523 [Alyxoria varia]|nr:MAG: hypothetical protein M1831_004523 [Alyxoria varia]